MQGGRSCGTTGLFFLPRHALITHPSVQLAQRACVVEVCVVAYHRRHAVPLVDVWAPHRCLGIAAGAVHSPIPPADYPAVHRWTAGPVHPKLPAGGIRPVLRPLDSAGCKHTAWSTQKISGGVSRPPEFWVCQHTACGRNAPASGVWAGARAVSCGRGCDKYLSIII